MLVRCECGKTLEVPDAYVGKNARCPACKTVFKITPNGQDAAPSKIQVQCSSCGKKLNAPPSAAGKQISCPGCNAPLTVPAAAPKPAAPKPAAPTSKPTQPDDAGLELEDMRFAPTPPPPAKQQAKDDDEEEDPGQEYGVAKLKCPNCGAELNQGASFCVECGTNVSTGSKINTVQAKEAKKEKAEAATKKIAVIIAVSIVAAAVIGAAVWYFVFFKKTSSNPQAPNAAQDIRANPSERASESENKNKGYIETVVGAYTESRKTLEDLKIAEAVKAFEAKNGRYPRDLDELQLEIPLPKLPEGQKYEYDSKTGVITIVSNGTAEK